jgi:hypothetical protein
MLHSLIRSLRANDWTHLIANHSYIRSFVIILTNHPLIRSVRVDDWIHHITNHSLIFSSLWVCFCSVSNAAHCCSPVGACDLMNQQLKSSHVNRSFAHKEWWLNPSHCKSFARSFTRSPVLTNRSLIQSLWLNSLHCKSFVRSLIVTCRIDDSNSFAYASFAHSLVKSQWLNSSHCKSFARSFIRSPVLHKQVVTLEFMIELFGICFVRSFAR